MTAKEGRQILFKFNELFDYGFCLHFYFNMRIFHFFRIEVTHSSDHRFHFSVQGIASPEEKNTIVGVIVLQVLLLFQPTLLRHDRGKTLLYCSIVTTSTDRAESRKNN